MLTFIFFQFMIGRTKEMTEAAIQNHDTGPKSYTFTISPAAFNTSVVLYCIMYPLVMS